jgi:hypothetical protein
MTEVIGGPLAEGASVITESTSVRK